MNNKAISSTAPAPPRWLRSEWITKLLIAVAVIAAIVLLWWFLPVARWIESFRLWVADQGVWGHLVFALVYAAATVVLAPGSLLTLAAGLAFGLSGFPTVVVGATLGAGLSFLAGRYVARGWVEKQVDNNRLFKAIDRAIESDGWKIVGLMRLSPLVPFNLQNYFFGITKVGFWPYIITTFFGIMPGTLLYVWLGSLGAEIGGAGGEASLVKYLFLGFGLLVTIAVTVIVSRKAKQKLEETGIGGAAEPAVDTK